MTYQLCQGRVDHHELADTKLPCASRTETQWDVKVYAVEVLEEKDGQVKIHYSGYSSEYDK